MKHVVVSSAGETTIFFRHLNSNHTDLNARSRETERSDRARSNRERTQIQIDRIDAIE